MSLEAQHEIERLNTDCTCITLDLESLCRAVEQVVGDPEFCRDLAATHPHLLSAQPMFLSASHAERMQGIIRSIEAVARLPSYQSAVLELAPEIARFQPGPVGVFMGYPIRSIAIVDQSPVRQYLYPEFVLFQRLFEAHGMTAVIAAPEDLSHRDNALWCGEFRIDLVYNRLTDFYFNLPESKMLRAAYLAGEVVVTPSPRVHALLANKQNLALLTREETLKKWGVEDHIISTLLNGIPETVLLTLDNADECWALRKHLFFKPSAEFGSKAAYRGDKITRKVWGEILNAQYVAQEIVPPSARTVAIDGKFQNMKADLRNYTYDGKVQLVAARLYQGQTTNFRSPGGGFAPVFIGDVAPAQSCR